MPEGEWANNCILGGDQVSIVVQITDSCPECQANQFDIQALTYNKVQCVPACAGLTSIVLRSI